MERAREEGAEVEVEAPAPLSDRERVVVTDTWAKVYLDSEEVGVAILLRCVDDSGRSHACNNNRDFPGLFGTTPSSKRYFSQFRDVEDPLELERSPQLRKHALRVMGGINTLVENLHDHAKVESVLKAMGKSHVLRHKVEPIYFKIVSGLILEVLAERYPQVVTAEVAAAWTKLLAIMCWKLSAVYNELGWIPGPGYQNQQHPDQHQHQDHDTTGSS